MRPVKTSLSSRLGDAMVRRRTALGHKVSPTRSMAATDPNAQIVELPENAQPLSDLLGKSRFTVSVARDTSYLHVSDLVGKCIRRIALVEQLGLQGSPQALHLGDEVTFAQGDAIHDTVRARVGYVAPANAWGRWRCLCAQTVTPEPCLLSEVEPGRTCPHCKSMVNIYKEVSILNEQYGMVGNPDLLTYHPDLNALHVNEIKSMADNKWKELLNPIPDHVIQSLFYWFLLKEAGYRITDRVSLLYVTKGWSFSGNVTKELTFHAPSMVHRLKDYLTDALAIKATRKGGDLPVRTLCASPMSPDAKKCVVCTQCFGGNSAERPVEVSFKQATGQTPSKKDGPAPARPSAPVRRRA
jgi:hypothetical protein